MRLEFVCSDCLEADQPAFYRLPLSDGGLYPIDCAAGHKFVVGLTSFRFELLSEIAVQALVDGYLRESVLSFSSSLERFFEFYVRLCWEAENVPNSVRETTWKAVAQSSERQLGLFAATYSLQARSPPPLLAPPRQVAQ
ncbi:MAG TPA: hypothetical protein VGN91_29440 [Bosea sp. (in: a-proteobacteria)]|nr:hypothetical protein [Bosea sp. (in: a-proteobacteria)]